jgi:hypothetical protein
MHHAWLVLAIGCGSSPSAKPDAAVDIDAPAARIGEDIATNVEAGALAVDATHVYFTNNGSIARVPKAGGAPDTLAAGRAAMLDASSTDLCWVDTGTHAADFLDGSIHCAPKTGGDTRITGAYFPSALAVDGNTIYWVEVDGGSVKQIDKDGTHAATLDNSPTGKTGIALTPEKLVWIASGPGPDVVAMSRTTGVKTPLSTEEYSPRGVALDGEDVYWIVQHALSDNGALRVARAGTAPIDIVSEEYYPWSLVKAAGALYWTSKDRIRTVALAGGAASTLADQGKLGALATDGDYLYWSEPDRQAIVRLPLR